MEIGHDLRRDFFEVTAFCKYKSFKLKTSLNIFKVDYGKNTSIKGVVKKI